MGRQARDKAAGQTLAPAGRVIRPTPSHPAKVRIMSGDDIPAAALPVCVDQTPPELSLDPEDWERFRAGTSRDGLDESGRVMDRSVTEGEGQHKKTFSTGSRLCADIYVIRWRLAPIALVPSPRRGYGIFRRRNVIGSTEHQITAAKAAWERLSRLKRLLSPVILRLLARLRYAQRRHGPLGFIRLAGRNLVHYTVGPRRGLRPSPTEVSFDHEFGTDTSGTREIGSLDVTELAAACHTVRYEPRSPQLVRVGLEKLSIDPSEFTFVDFGSGKGRVLLVAASFPFQEVIGVEFSRGLHEIALKNIARLPSHRVRACGIRSVHGDAAAFDLPQSDLVCYFYNPFGPPILAVIAQRLIAHHDQHGHKVIVIYHDPRHREVFECTEKFVILDQTEDTLVLTALRQSERATADHRSTPLALPRLRTIRADDPI
jgi:hypothetical protein